AVAGVEPERNEPGGKCLGVLFELGIAPTNALMAHHESVVGAELRDDPVEMDPDRLPDQLLVAGAVDIAQLVHGSSCQGTIIAENRMPSRREPLRSVGAVVIRVVRRLTGCPGYVECASAASSRMLLGNSSPNSIALIMATSSSSSSSRR